MSAFLVSSESIGMIASYAFNNDLLKYGCCYERQINFNTLEKTAEVLARKNIDSVNERYGNEDTSQEDREYIARSVLSAGKLNLRAVAPEDMAKTLNCYSYQSCEQDDFYDSDAFKIVTACRENLLRNLPGYENASGWR